MILPSDSKYYFVEELKKQHFGTVYLCPLIHTPSDLFHHLINERTKLMLKDSSLN